MKTLFNYTNSNIDLLVDHENKVILYGNVTMYDEIIEIKTSRKGQVAIRTALLSAGYKEHFNLFTSKALKEVLCDGN